MKTLRAGANVTENKSVGREQMLRDAANHLQSAIDLLDGAAAPGHIAAHVDLGLQQLKDVISMAPRAGSHRPDANDRDYRTAQTS
jgi:hypothetical protein